MMPAVVQYQILTSLCAAETFLGPLKHDEMRLGLGLDPVEADAAVEALVDGGFVTLREGRYRSTADGRALAARSIRGS